MLTKFTLALLAASSSLSAHASCLHGTTLLRREVSGGQVQVSSFGYDEEKGPLLWAGLSPNNTACNTGRNQSPIVLDASIPDAPAITVSFQPTHDAELENLGSTLEVVGVNGTTNFQGKDHFLRQFHFHTPSEHRINGEYHPLEMHMVHESADGSFVVLGVFFSLTEDGTTTELLSAVTEHLSGAAEPGSITETGDLDFAELSNALQSKPKFHYTGSLTTPPCKEGINFVILKEPLALNVKTYNALKKIMKYNARYTQNALGRDNLLHMAAAQFA
ncbi:hypothetical protein V5O48_014176 [Marasmius crinis-equi]|uniref:Carbonic anhydrase n=1 Tax=Marasmius crinis-equi TaxID=585013 RepID=A0ABR3EY18_9AGAR